MYSLRYRYTYYLISIAFLVCVIIGALCIGSTNITISKVLKILYSHCVGAHQIEDISDKVIWMLRFPRVLVTSLVGGMLALAGLLMQAVLRNTLAEPYILGLSSGAAVGVFLTIALGFGWLGSLILSGSALVGSLVSLILLFLSCGSSFKRFESLILTGVTLNIFLGAFLSLLASMYPEKLSQIYFWTLGNLSLADWPHVLPMILALLFGLVSSSYLTAQLNILALGDSAAFHLGIRVSAIRIIILIIASFMTALSVAFVGIIGFVGLIVPHGARIVLGNDYKILIPTVTIFGAIFLVICDLLARIVLSPIELPIGVITGLIGAPIFAYLLRKKDYFFSP